MATSGHWRIKTTYLSVFFKNPRTGRYELINTIKKHFANCCTSCGLEGYNSSNKNCAYFNDGAAWNLCNLCRMVFCLSCRYHHKFLAKSDFAAKPLQMGCSNSAQWFANVMQEIMRPLQDFAIHFQDDILCATVGLQ